MLIGCARVPTVDRNLALQRGALTAAGCERIVPEQMPGAGADRPERMAAIGYAGSGDRLVAWKRDRLARAIRQPIDAVETMRAHHRLAQPDRSVRYDGGAGLSAAKTMLTNPDIGVASVAHRRGVSLATLYRYIPSARASSADRLRA